MDRETFKLLSYGQYVMTHRNQTIDQSVMQEFVDGALFAFDRLRKMESTDLVSVPVVQLKDVEEFELLSTNKPKE